MRGVLEKIAWSRWGCGPWNWATRAKSFGLMPIRDRNRAMSCRGPGHRDRLWKGINPRDLGTLFRQPDREHPSAAPNVERTNTAIGGVDGYEAMAGEMLELGRGMPGFIDFKSFHAEDAWWRTKRLWRPGAIILVINSRNASRASEYFKVEVAHIVRGTGFFSEGSPT
jgi:hypothetical protein